MKVLNFTGLTPAKHRALWMGYFHTADTEFAVSLLDAVLIQKEGCTVSLEVGDKVLFHFFAPDVWAVQKALREKHVNVSRLSWDRPIPEPECEVSREIRPAKIAGTNLEALFPPVRRKIGRWILAAMVLAGIVFGLEEGNFQLNKYRLGKLKDDRAITVSEWVDRSTELYMDNNK